MTENQVYVLLLTSFLLGIFIGYTIVKNQKKLGLVLAAGNFLVWSIYALVKTYLTLRVLIGSILMLIICILPLTALILGIGYLSGNFIRALLVRFAPNIVLNMQIAQNERLISTSKKWRFQIHLSTCLFLMIIAAVILWSNSRIQSHLNVELEWTSWSFDSGNCTFQARISRVYRLGWPLYISEIKDIESTQEIELSRPGMPPNSKKRDFSLEKAVAKYPAWKQDLLAASRNCRSDVIFNYSSFYSFSYVGVLGNVCILFSILVVFYTLLELILYRRGLKAGGTDGNSFRG